METKADRRAGRRGEQPAPDLEIHLGYWLRRVSNHVSGAFARALQTEHASVAEWVVLCRVRQRPGSTPGELAAALDLTRGAISKVVDKLEAKRWIARSTKAADSRVQLLSPTPRGVCNLPRLEKIADRNDRKFFDCLAAEERVELRRLLGKLADVHQIRNVPIE